MADFKLPDLGEGVTEAEIDRWLVKEGDVIAEDDLLVEVITDKATAEIPSPFAGTVSKIHVTEGDVVPVGTVLVTIGDGEVATGADAAADVLAPPLEQRLDAPPSPPPIQTPPAARRSDVKAMPPVRKLARELGIDIAAVAGSGPGGRILRDDVEAAAGAPAAAPTAASLVGRREPLRGIRRTIAERMAEAHRTIPPVTHVEECDITELDATRRIANERATDGVRLTFLPFIVKAVVAGLKRYPAMNASLDEDASEIVYHDAYNVGVAVDTPAGLTVPVVHDADKKKLKEIASEIELLAAAARDGRLRTEDLRGGTFTVTSPGPFGGLMATPIVFHPQVAILGVHRATDRPVVRDGQVVVRKIMNLSITFDHRVLDGMTAARFCIDVVNLLEHPAVLALEG